MGKAGKQADRQAAKKAAKQEDTEPPASSISASALVERANDLLVGCCAAKVLPGLKDVLTAPEGSASNGSKSQKAASDTQASESNDADNEDEKKEGDSIEGEKNDEAAPEKKVADPASELFSTIRDQLSLFNLLGLADPADEDSAKKAWLALKDLELDWGPRSKKRGTPATDRILENVHNNLPQYLHIMLALMVLRAFLFRSWFACLPWLLFYQIASIFIPLEGISQLPQVPIEKCPVKFRVAGTMAIHCLVWFFFLVEFVYRAYFFEKFFVLGLITYHAYAVRPEGK